MKKLYFSVLVTMLTGIVFQSTVQSQNGSEALKWESVNSGTWQLLGNGGFSSGGVWDVSLAFHASGQPWVAFNDQAGQALHVMRLDGSAWSEIGSMPASARGMWPSLDFSSSGTPYLAFRQLYELTEKASVIQYDGTSWDFTGSAMFTPASIQHPSMAVGPDDAPYVVFQDGASNSKGSVMKYDGSAWVYVGNPGFTPSFARNPKIAFSPSGIPYVAFGSVFTGWEGHATVMKFNGTAWELVGIDGFSEATIDSISLAFDSTEAPCVAYADGAYAWKATVMRFNGTAWENIGNPGFSDGAVGCTSLAFSPDGRAVVTFQDAGHNDHVSAMIYGGGSWEYLGIPGFSEGSCDRTHLRFSPSGHPCVAFNDLGNSGKATVMIFDGTLGMTETKVRPMTLFPDPAQNLLRIDMGKSGNISYNLEIFNLTGVRITMLSFSGSEKAVDVSSLPSGVYIVKVTSDLGTVTARFIKN